MSFHHHHDHHLSLNHEGHWGTTDDFATSFLHFSLFSTALWDLPNSRPVHSLMLSPLPPFLCQEDQNTQKVRNGLFFIYICFNQTTADNVQVFEKFPLRQANKHTIIIIIYPLTARDVGAPQMIWQSVSNIQTLHLKLK